MSSLTCLQRVMYYNLEHGVVKCHLSRLFLAAKWDKQSQSMFLLNTWANTALTNHPSSSFLWTPKAYEMGMYDECQSVNGLSQYCFSDVSNNKGDILLSLNSLIAHVMYQWSSHAFSTTYPVQLVVVYHAGRPDLLRCQTSSYVLQVLLKNPEVFPGQRGYVNPPMGLALDSSPSQTCPD